MRHVLFCGRTLRLALLLPIIAVALIVGAAGAHAAAWVDNSGATACTGPKVLVDYNQPGNCAFSGSGTAKFTGQFLTPAILIDQSLCPPQAADPTDTICGHFGMDFNNVHGSVTVTISFDGNNDLDLCVTTASATIVGNCSQGTGATETVTFNVSCTDTRYEAQILPISFGPGVFPTPLDPVTYNGNVRASLYPCLPGGATGDGNVGRETYDHHGQGGGEAENDDTHEHERATGDVEERDGDHHKRGKVRYTKQGCDMRSTSIDSITWDDANRTMIVTGYGTVNGVGNVPFVFTQTDNGPGSADTYSVQSTCGGHGHYTDKSDYKYRHDS